MPAIGLLILFCALTSPASAGSSDDDHAAARAALDAAESASPEDVLFSLAELGSLPPPLRERAVTLLSRASAGALKDGDPVMGLQLCQMALVREPADRAALVSCVTAGRALEQFDLAERWVAALREHHPGDAIGALLAAEVAFSQGDWSAARRAAAEALSDDGLDDEQTQRAQTVRADANAEITERELRMAEAEALRRRIEAARLAARRPASELAELERRQALEEAAEEARTRDTERAAERATRSLATRHGVEVVVPEEPMIFRGIQLLPPEAAVLKELAPVVENELSVYPRGFLRAAGLRAVYLAGEVLTPQGPVAGVGAGVGFIVLRVGGSGTHATMSVAKTLHHEIFHVAQGRPVVQRALAGWEDGNPPGFEYRRRSQLERMTRERPDPCFVTPYATEAAVEDQAEVYARLMLNPRQLERAAASNACLAGKVRRVRAAAAALDPRMNDSRYERLAARRIGEGI